MREITIKRPDDWHLHLRDGPILSAVIDDTARHFGRAIIMPNLLPPIITSADAVTYRERIIACLDGATNFRPLMTLYLTENTNADDVAFAANAGIVQAVKLYPAGATTNSASGVIDLNMVMPVLEKMALIGLPLCVHGEVTDPNIDIFDREEVFIDQVLEPLRKKLPELKIILEHVTTRAGVNYVRGDGNKLAATITVHHLFINRNHILAGGIHPHFYCLPVAKRESQRQALIEAATSGEPCFFLGSDSAPHLNSAKLSDCGCAGIYTAPVIMSCLAHIFESREALGELEKFTSLNGAKFYSLPENSENLTMVKQDKPVLFPEFLETTDGPIKIFDCGEPLFWTIKE